MKMLRINTYQWLLLSMVLFFLTLIFCVWSRYYANQIGYVLHATVQDEKRLTDEKRALTVEMNNLASLKQVEHMARTQLKMQELEAEQVRYLKLHEKEQK